MKLFKKVESVNNDVRYCKNKKCKSELRSNSPKDYCINCQSKRDEKRKNVLAAMGIVILTGAAQVAKVVKPEKIIALIFKK